MLWERTCHGPRTPALREDCLRVWEKEKTEWWLEGCWVPKVVRWTGHQDRGGCQIFQLRSGWWSLGSSWSSVTKGQSYKEWWDEGTKQRWHFQDIQEPKAIWHTEGISEHSTSYKCVMGGYFNKLSQRYKREAMFMGQGGRSLWVRYFVSVCSLLAGLRLELWTLCMLGKYCSTELCHRPERSLHKGAFQDGGKPGLAKTCEGGLRGEALPRGQRSTTPPSKAETAVIRIT